jgi:hypothetical protein
MQILAPYGYGVERLSDIQLEGYRLQDAGAGLTSKYNRRSDGRPRARRRTMAIASTREVHLNYLSGLLPVTVRNSMRLRWLLADLLQAVTQFFIQFRVLTAVDSGVKTFNVGHGHMN